MAFVHVGRRVSGRATRLTRSTAREARPRRRGGDLVRSGAPDMSGISRQSEKPRGIPDSYTTTEAPVIAHHAKLGGLRLAPKGPAILGGAPPIKEKKGRGVNWFTYHVAFVRAQTHLHYLQSRSLERGGGH